MNLKHALRKSVNLLGFDITRLHNSPKRSLLGLTRMDFRTIIDVGANEGQFARMISEFFPKAQIHCFEPLEAPFRKLADWAATQEGRVHCYSLALGDQEGEAQMHMHEQHTYSSSLLSSTDNFHQLYPQTKAEHLVRVQLSTLDQALGDTLDRMSQGTLLKLDVQGYEDRVLSGATRLLGKVQACILEVSLESFYEGQADFQSLSRLLYETGFRYAGNLDQVYGKDGRVLWFDALFLKVGVSL